MAKVTGINKVVRNLNQEINKIEARSMAGLIGAAIIVRRDMDHTPPKIPVDQGNLRASWFTDPYYQGSNPVVRLGFSAEYAWEVHEKVGANFKRPGAGAKFFEAALKRNQKKMLQEIAKG
jgi:hypothetical protein